MTVFAQIIAGELPAEFVYQDDLAVAFKDINPAAPFHVLVVPRKPISMVSASSDDEAPLLGHLLRVAAKVAAAAGYADAFRVVINNGADVGQTVFHLHLHVLAGRPFSWPPG